MSGAIRVITASSTLVASDYSILASAVSGSIVLILPPGMVKGKVYQVLRTDNTLLQNVAIVSNSGIKTINGSASVILSQYVSATFHFDGTDWWKF